MRNKFVSLILGLMIILLAPALITSCAHKCEVSSKLQVAASVPLEQAISPTPAIAFTSQKLVKLKPSERICMAGMFAFAQEQDPGGTIDSTAVNPGTSGEITTDNLLGWQNILILILGVLSVLFGTLWKRASNVISAINDALKDGKVDKVELNNILKAWKG